MATENNQELEKHIMILLSQIVNSNNIVIDRISKLVAFVVGFAAKLDKISEINFKEMSLEQKIEFVFSVTPQIYSTLINVHMIPESFQDEAKAFLEMHDKFKDKIKASLEIYELTAHVTGLPHMEENIGVLRRFLRRLCCVRIPALCRSI